MAMWEPWCKMREKVFLIDTPPPVMFKGSYTKASHMTLSWSDRRNLSSKLEEQYKQSVSPKISLKSYFHKNSSLIFLSDKSKMVLSVQLSARCKWHKWMITLNTSSLRRELWDLTKVSSCDYFQEITWK